MKARAVGIERFHVINVLKNVGSLSSILGAVCLARMGMEY
ncbi:hypothetical protein C5167_049013 [Papaver somniferum]|uniref:Uncharacterized protein n=1 Tax=Papaver somniferum TaxID=3469 RepID=A0A4Y7KJL6_PAPSO|nr:hypothetical protein C5167_049013 [Papaver somniferum]